MPEENQASCRRDVPRLTPAWPYVYWCVVAGFRLDRQNQAITNSLKTLTEANDVGESQATLVNRQAYGMTSDAK